MIPKGENLQSTTNLECAMRILVCCFFASSLRQAWFACLKQQTPGLRQGFVVLCGERGIRTPGTLIGYASLANWWIKPLSHLSGVCLKQSKSIKNSPISTSLPCLLPTRFLRQFRRTGVGSGLASRRPKKKRPPKRTFTSKRRM